MECEQPVMVKDGIAVDHPLRGTNVECDGSGEPASERVERPAEQALGNLAVWDISRLKPNPLNPRGEIQPDDPTISELAASIQAHGLLQPIIATPTGLIVAGHRRYYACIVAGLQTVNVVVRELSEREQLEVMLIENVQRRDLSPVQIAKGYKALNDRGMSIAEICKKVGWAKASVSKHLAILDLPEEVQKMTSMDTFALGYIPYLLELKDSEAQIKFAREATEGNWLINELASAVNRSKPSRHIENEVVSQYDPWHRVYIHEPVLQYLVEWAAREKRSVQDLITRQLIFAAEIDLDCRCGAPSEKDSLSDEEADVWYGKLQPFTVMNEPQEQ